MTRNQIVAAAVAVGVAATGVGIGATLTGGDASTSPKASTRSGSVLTGKPGSAGRVLAVKIDNVGPARPATGLNQAAVVYGVQVEGGLSRLVAVFDDNHPVPERVGPVRSARETDVQLLTQYGNPNLAYSGAQSQFKRDLNNNPDINTVKNGYYRDGSRNAPHNQYLRTGGAFAGAGKAEDVGFRFGPRPAGGTPTDTVRVQYPAMRYSFTFEDGRYAVWFDGVKTPWRTDNVVVQDVDIVESKYKSRTGFVPNSRTVGSGDVVVHRDGVGYTSTWKRSSAKDGTDFGVNFKPGNTWVVLK